MNFPGHKYLGPGNKLLNGEPIDTDDRIARIHDKEYESAQSYSDIRAADRKAIESFGKDLFINRNWHSAVGAVGLGVIYAAESVTGVLYPGTDPSMSKQPKKRRNELELLQSGAFERDRSKKPRNNPEPLATAEGNMDVEDVMPQDDPAANAGGAGTGSSAGHSPITPIYTGIAQGPNKFRLNYHKSYFYLSNSLPQDRKSKMNPDFIRYYPGGCHDIPWNMLFCYVSPREANLLRTQFTEVVAKHAVCTVSSLGVRLPFETNTSKVVMANANAQYPICDYGPLDKYYYTETLVSNIQNTRKKMIGGNIYGENETGATNTDKFTNISDQASSRNFENPLAILYPEPDKELAKKSESAIKQHMAEPQIYQFCTMVNGSNYLGPVFQRKNQPSNGLLFSRNTIQEWVKPMTTRVPGYTTLELPHKVFNKNFISIDGSIESQANGTYIPPWNDSYEIQTLENHNQFSLNNPKPITEQPRFLVGMIPLRNKDGTLLEAVWEFILDFDLELEVTNGVTGFYGRHETFPESNFMHPNVHIGSLDYCLTNAVQDIRTIQGIRHSELMKDEKNTPTE